MPAHLLFTSQVVVLIASAIASFTDVRRFKVYNLLTFPLALSGLLFYGFSAGWQGMMYAAGGLGLGLGILIVPYIFGMVGAGDVKFFAGIGAWLGAEPMLDILIVACWATGIYSAVVMLKRGGLKYVWLNLQLACAQVLAFGTQICRSNDYENVQDVLAKAPDYRSRLVPFSAMVSVGAVVSLLWRALN